MDRRAVNLSSAELAAIERLSSDEARRDEVIKRHRDELLALPHVVWVGPGTSETVLKLGSGVSVMAGTGPVIVVEVDSPSNLNAVKRELPKTVDGYPVLVNQPVAREWSEAAAAPHRADF
jgi:hypothetical protein